MRFSKVSWKVNSVCCLVRVRSFLLFGAWLWVLLWLFLCLVPDLCRSFLTWVGLPCVMEVIYPSFCSTECFWKISATVSAISCGSVIVLLLSNSRNFIYVSDANPFMLFILPHSSCSSAAAALQRKVRNVTATSLCPRLATFLQYFSRIATTFRQHCCNAEITLLQRLSNIATTSRQGYCNIRAIYLQCSGSIAAMYRQCYCSD